MRRAEMIKTNTKSEDTKIPFQKMCFNPISGKHESPFSVGTTSRNGKFIKGPIPFYWVQTANALPGKVGAVGIALWFLKGVKKTDSFRITKQIEQLAGCTRQALSRALDQLESAELIELQRQRGARAIVKILETD